MTADGAPPLRPPPPGRRTFTFPADPDLVGPTVDRVMDECGPRAPSDSRRRLALRIAVAEALANAVLHGSGADPGKRVAVEVDADDRGVEVTVADEGDGFDPGAMADPTLPAARERARGRGLFLLRRLTDGVRWDRSGSRVTLVMRS